jgi:hypothetical protein
MQFVSVMCVKLPVMERRAPARRIARWGARRNAVSASRSRERLSMRNALLRSIRSRQKPQKSAIF